MSEITNRKTQHCDNRLTIEHQFGAKRGVGDTEFEFIGDIKTFQIESYTLREPDRDGYSQSDESEIALNREEAYELYLFLHMWLEQHPA